MPTSAEILALPMQQNDAGAATVRDYLKALLTELWREGEGFSAKRPFGNSGWECELHASLVKAGFASGSFDTDGYLDDCDERKCNELIFAAIASL